MSQSRHPWNPADFRQPTGQMGPGQSAQLGTIAKIDNYYSNQIGFRQANGLPPYGAAVNPLARWFSGGVSGKKISFWGDSTTLFADDEFSFIIQESKVGGSLQGVTYANVGLNGQTMEGATNNINTDLTPTAPQLVVLCFLINDVRLGNRTTAQMQAALVAARAAILTNLPNADVIMWTPNSLLNGAGDGFVVPNTAAQDYSDRMWNAYNNYKAAKPANTAFIDKMETFGRTVTTGNSSALMTDSLHPTGLGQQLSTRAQLMPLITPPATPINLTVSAAAWASNPNNPWTVYSRALEDTRYCTRIRKLIINFYGDLSGTLLMYIGGRVIDSVQTLSASTFLTGDFLWTPGGVFTIPSTGEWSDRSANEVQCYGYPTVSFPANVTGNLMVQYRRV